MENTSNSISIPMLFYVFVVLAKSFWMFPDYISPRFPSQLKKRTSQFVTIGFFIISLTRIGRNRNGAGKKVMALDMQ